MCRTVHAVLQTLICGVQMLVRVLMTILLMIENLIRMILQTLYNFISFMLQLLSLIPICVVFLVSARLKCFMCGGGGGCQPGRGGACDCIMSLVAIVILFFIFKSTGVMDKIFYSMGYAKAAYESEPYVPTPGDITECSRNDTDQDVEYLVRTETYTAAAETTAATYLHTLMEDYFKISTKTPTFVTSPPEPSDTDVLLTSELADIVMNFTTPVVLVFTTLTTAATVEVTNIMDSTATEIVAEVGTTFTKQVDEIMTPITVGVTDVGTSFTTATGEIGATNDVDITIGQVEVVTPTVAKDNTPIDNEAGEAVTSYTHEEENSLTSYTTEAPDIQISDTTVTEAPDMGISDTPFNTEETT